jgi:hypothetical protein
VTALFLAPLTASAQGNNTNSLLARVQALEAVVTTLQNSLTAETAARAAADAALSARAAKLEGTITAADLAGTYRARGVFSDVDGGASATVGHAAINGTLTLNPNGTGTIVQSGAAIELTGSGTVWTDNNFNFPAEQIGIGWSYANGILNVNDGTPNLDINFAVGAGGRVLIYSGLSDDNTIDIVVATRLQ